MPNRTPSSLGERTPSSLTKKKRYQTLEAMMKDYHIPNLRSLIALNDEELESLISIVALHDGKVSLQGLLEGHSEDDKIKLLISAIAEKLCRCIKAIPASHGQQLPESSKIGICINTIFNKKGISIPKFQCFPIPLLIPSKGSHAVLRRK